MARQAMGLMILYAVATKIRRTSQTEAGKAREARHGDLRQLLFSTLTREEDGDSFFVRPDGDD